MSPLQAIIQAALAAFFSPLKEKAMSSIKEKAKELAEKLGIKIEDWTDEQLVKLVAAKDSLDTETRRKVRAFWAPAGFVIGMIAGYVLSVIL